MRDVIRPGTILFLITFVTVLCISLAYSATKETIANQLIQAKNNSMQKVIPAADDFSELELIPGYDTNSVFEALLQGEIIGYVIESSSKGYGGNINVLTSLDLEGTIIGVDIVSHSETPGLGTKAALPAYLIQYENKNSFMTVVKSAPGENDIQAIASATITSKAVTTAVNSALDYYNVYLKEAN